MRLLQHDIDILKEEHKAAYNFLIAAQNREECFNLLCLRHKTCKLNDWQRKRLHELLAVPSCNTAHFLKITENMRKE